jgi:hypothetical protein
MNELDRARLDTILEINDGFMDYIMKITKTHGEDPELVAILASAFTLSINQIDKIAPGFVKYMVQMLEPQV